MPIRVIDSHHFIPDLIKGSILIVLCLILFKARKKLTGYHEVAMFLIATIEFIFHFDDDKNHELANGEY